MMTERLRSMLTSTWAFLMYGILLGALIILGIRLATYSQPHTHYHANFAVYINSQREQFREPMYYEEVALCTASGTVTPKQRAHMHDENNGTAHVHDDGVTWGQFFENIGWYVGPDFIRTPQKLYAADDVNKLHIMLNGQDLTGLQTITNEVIGDKDRLLVSFGDIDDATLAKEYKTVPSDAAHFDATSDPASCSGPEGDGLSAKLHHLF